MRKQPKMIKQEEVTFKVPEGKKIGECFSASLWKVVEKEIKGTWKKSDFTFRIYPTEEAKGGSGQLMLLRGIPVLLIWPFELMNSPASLVREYRWAYATLELVDMEDNNE